MNILDLRLNNEELNEVLKDDFFIEAFELANEIGYVSCSMLQKKYSISYPKARALYEVMSLFKGVEYYQNIEDCKGIYVMRMEEDFTCEENFDLAEKSSKRRDTSIIKFEKNEILYLGKSYNIKTRAKNHFIGIPTSTYSLKMSDEKRKNKNGRALSEFVKMYIFCLKSEYANDAKYYEILLPAIEDILHDKLQPIIGTPRK